MPQITEEQRREMEEKIKKMSPEELKEFQKQQCIFCQIIAGKVPSKKIYSDDRCLAVLDINPAAPGHILLLPKEHYAIMPQIPDEEIGHMFTVAKALSQVVLKKLKAEGTNIFVANGMVAGQKAQHFMIHIIPRREGDGILEISEHLVEEMIREKLSEAIGNRVNGLLGIKKEKTTMEKSKTKEEKRVDEPEETEEQEEKTNEEKIEEPKKEVVKKKRKIKEKKPEKKSEEAEEESEEEKTNGANLDDIANLFK